MLSEVYLRAKIENELIGLLSKTVNSALVPKINKAPFWSLNLDSTGDITGEEQLSIVLR